MKAIDKKKITRELEKDAHRARARRVAQLRAALRDARRSKRSKLTAAKSFCAQERDAARQRVRELRAKNREEVNAAADAIRGEARTLCSIQRDAAGAEVERARAELAGASKDARDYRAIDRSAAARRQKDKPRRGRAAELRSESDDEVIDNIPAELVALFRRVGPKIKGSARMSRTEAFLKYAEEHPREVVAAYEDAGDELIAQHERQLRELAKTHGEDPDLDFPFGANVTNPNAWGLFDPRLGRYMIGDDYRPIVKSTRAAAAALLRRSPGWQSAGVVVRRYQGDELARAVRGNPGDELAPLSEDERFVLRSHDLEQGDRVTWEAGSRRYQGRLAGTTMVRHRRVALVDRVASQRIQGGKQWTSEPSTYEVAFGDLSTARAPLRGTESAGTLKQRLGAIRTTKTQARKLSDAELDARHAVASRVHSIASGRNMGAVARAATKQSFILSDEKIDRQQRQTKAEKKAAERKAAAEARADELAKWKAAPGETLYSDPESVKRRVADEVQRDDAHELETMAAELGKLIARETDELAFQTRSNNAIPAARSKKYLTRYRASLAHVQKGLKYLAALDKAESDQQRAAARVESDALFDEAAELAARAGIKGTPVVEAKDYGEAPYHAFIRTSDGGTRGLFVEGETPNEALLAMVAILRDRVKKQAPRVSRRKPTPPARALLDRAERDYARAGVSVAELAAAPPPRPAGYGTEEPVSKKRQGDLFAPRQLRLFNPSKPRGELAELGKLTEVVLVDGRRLAWSLRDAPVLCYEVTGRGVLHVLYHPHATSSASSGRARRSRTRTHWGRVGRGKWSEGEIPIGPWTPLGPVRSLVYTTQKGSDGRPVDYEHRFGDFGDGSRARRDWKPPFLVAHKCAGSCQHEGRLALSGGTYRVTSHGIVG